MMDDLLSREIGAAALSVFMIGAYHGYVHLRGRNDPDYTIQLVVINVARAAWAERMMREDEGILAVQTLRNSIMVATFFASTAVAFVVGTITLSLQSDALRQASQALAASYQGLWFAKLLLLLVDMMCAFAHQRRDSDACDDFDHHNHRGQGSTITAGKDGVIDDSLSLLDVEL
jgi:uncharacterized membrane protein